MQKPRLLDEVRQTCRVRHYSIRTEKASFHWIKRYIYFHNKRHLMNVGAVGINALLNAVNTTMIYAHVLSQIARVVLNPLDMK